MRDPERTIPRAIGLALGITVVVYAAALGVLLYYAVANASALTQPPEQRRYLRALAWTGLVGCVVLVATLPLGAVATGVAVFAAGVALRWWRVRPRPGMNEA